MSQRAQSAGRSELLRMSQASETDLVFAPQLVPSSKKEYYFFWLDKFYESRMQPRMSIPLMPIGPHARPT
jgi:hypothetical protein